MLYSCVWKDAVPETNLFYWLYLQNNMQDPLFHLESEDFLCEWLLCCAFAFFACFLELVYVIQLFLSAFFRFVVKYFHVVSEVGEKTWTLNCSIFSLLLLNEHINCCAFQISEMELKAFGGGIDVKPGTPPVSGRSTTPTSSPFR